MDHALLVRMSDALAYPDEQFQPRPQAEFVRFAVRGERPAFDVFHGKVRHPIDGGAGVEDLGDGRMLHLRQQLALNLEVRELARIEAPSLQTLQGDGAVHRLQLFGTVDLAHAAAAEHGFDAIGPEPRAGCQHLAAAAAVAAARRKLLRRREIVITIDCHRRSPGPSPHGSRSPAPIRYTHARPSAMRPMPHDNDTTQRTELSPGPRRAGPHSACVVVIHGEGLGKRIDVGERAIVVGRSQESDLHIPHPSVSRQHCSIWRDADGYRVRDLGATNRTRVNEDKVQESALMDGDHITVGETILKFISHASVEARYHEEVYQLATHDALTDLCNRRHFMELLEKEIARAQRHGRPLALAILDVDLFKRINDEHGHIAGDGVLRQLADILRQHVRGEDVAARIGGEEYGDGVVFDHARGARTQGPAAMLGSRRAGSSRLLRRRRTPARGRFAGAGQRDADVGVLAIRRGR
jgi:GGDEF domain-containing protein